MYRLFFCYTIMFMSLLSSAFRADAMVQSEQRDSSVIEEFSIYYKCDSIDVNPNYLDNKNQIAHIIRYIQKSPRIDSITIYAYASPEGGYKHNKWLSQERAKAARRFLLSHSPDSAKLNSGKIKISPIAENWGGLITYVENDYQRPDRNEVLSILLDGKINDDLRKRKLQRLDGGRTWRYLIDNYMPNLRAANWICVWADVISPLPLLCVMKDAPEAPEMKLVRQPVDPPQRWRTVAALKTNMLYDAVTAVNFAVEIPFNEKFSILYEHHCPWWLSDNNKLCLQFLSFGGEARWWFAPRTEPETSKMKQRDALVGHFLGLYGWTGKSDIQAGRKFGCYQFEFCSAGITYGYSLPVGKYVNMEFSLSVGYAQIPYQHYIPTPDWEILIRDKDKAGRLHYIGPTKAEVSLVIPFRAKVKGGAR